MIDDTVSVTHQKLYHYTSIEAFLKIFQSQTLWASHFRALNDTSEMTHFDSVLYDKIHEMIPISLPKIGLQIISNDTRSDLARELFDLLHNDPIIRKTRSKYFDPYVVSFCSHASLESV